MLPRLIRIHPQRSHTYRVARAFSGNELQIHLVQGGGGRAVKLFDRIGNAQTLNLMIGKSQAHRNPFFGWQHEQHREEEFPVRPTGAPRPS